MTPRSSRPEGESTPLPGTVNLRLTATQYCNGKLRWRSKGATSPASRVRGSATDPGSLSASRPGSLFPSAEVRAHPMPVVMISSLTDRGCETTLRALELGAVDFVSKPKIDVADGTVLLANEILEKVKAAAQ